jgi:hypothetical protein
MCNRVLILFLVKCTVPHTLFLRNIINTTAPAGSLIEQGSSFSYTCLEDYQPINELGTVQCLDDGKLSHYAHCIPKSCKDHPPSITNGQTIFHSTKHASIARYRYRIENNHLSKLTCQFGQWLPAKSPRCLPSNKIISNSPNNQFDFFYFKVFCTNPGPLLNGRIYVTLKDERISSLPIRSEFRAYIPNVGHGRTIEFECDAGK